jgi:hypothetical protein
MPSQLIFTTEGSAPATPGSGTVSVYTKTSDKRLYYKDDTGTEIGPLNTGGSSLPVADTTAVVMGSADNTKLLRFEVDGFTTATTRVLTPPNADATIVGTDTTQTLTNKTINASNNTVTNVSLTTSVTGTLPDDNGGTGQSTYSTGDILYASGTDTLAKRTVGSTGDVLTVAGGVPTWAAPAASGGITLGTPQASTSGTSIDFTGIPSTAKRVTINFKAVSTNGASIIIIQIGDAGGIEATGYLSTGTSVTGATSVQQTTGFGTAGTAAAGHVYHGSIILSLQNTAAFSWCCASMLARSDTGETALGGGSKSLSASLDRVRITTVSGTPTFDAGEINISYE